MKETSEIPIIYFEEIDYVQQLHFLFTFCPYMGYFNARSIKTLDIQSFLPIIFKKMIHNKNEYLRSLCFQILIVNDQI